MNYEKKTTARLKKTGGPTLEKKFQQRDLRNDFAGATSENADGVK